MITTAIALLLLVFCGGAACAAILDIDRAERHKHASDVWRVTTLRNGVTAESPFSGLRDSINSPGLVEVHPLKRTHPPTSPEPLSTAPVPTAARMEPLPTEGRQPVERAEESRNVPEPKATEFRWGYPKGGFYAAFPEPSALDALNRLIADGERRKTVLSWAVFGSTGGSVYSQAKAHIEEALSNAE